MDNPNLEQMVDFVASRGGTVRFDRYMEKHLFGNNGFYSERVVIGENGHGHFTTYAEKPAFAFLVYLALKNQGLAGKQFLEIGGGSGSFKRNYLHFSPDTEYMSVDASARLLGEQSKLGGISHIGRAENLPFGDESLEGCIFGNELLDILTCRVFVVSNGGVPRIKTEGYVTIKDGQLAFVYSQADRDEFVELYEAFLRESRPNIGEGNIFSVSPLLPVAISEIARVLKRGKVILADYGFLSVPEEAGKARYCVTPFFVEGSIYHEVEDVLKRPYETDISHPVDFEFAIWLALKTGLFSRVSASNLGNFFKSSAIPMSPKDFQTVLNLGMIERIYDFLKPKSEIVLYLEKR